MGVERPPTLPPYRICEPDFWFTLNCWKRGGQFFSAFIQWQNRGPSLQKSPTWRLSREGGPHNIKKKRQKRPKISILCSCNRVFLGILAQNPTLRLYRGGPPSINKKYKILWCNTLKFRSFVVATAFFWRWRQRRKYWHKTLLDDLSGGWVPPNNEKMQNTMVQHPEISKFCGCNGFFWKLEGGVLKKYNID